MTDAATFAESALQAILAPVRGDDDQQAFQDSDGLISFVNLSSSFVQKNKEFPVGQQVCDTLCNFVATLRIKVFAALSNGTVTPLPGDTKPTTQWDPAVTHYMFYLLSQAGGLTNFHVTTETYSITQVMTEFSTAFVKLIFDAAVVPEAVIADVTNFLSGVGQSLRASWDDRERTYSTCLLGQCHEAVPLDASGQDFRYFPKIKYYRININSSQTEFTTPCSATKTVTFNFQYEQYVTALANSVLDTSTEAYKKFTKFMNSAQNVNYKDAQNSLDKILGGATSSALPSFAEDRSMNLFSVNLGEYPKVAVSPAMSIEAILNRRVA